jgi:hypothetical protein
MSLTIESLWKDRKRYFGLPLSFTRYALSEDRLFLSVGFLNIKDDEILLYRVRDIDTERSLWQRLFGVGNHQRVYGGYHRWRRLVPKLFGVDVV